MSIRKQHEKKLFSTRFVLDRVWIYHFFSFASIVLQFCVNTRKWLLSENNFNTPRDIRSSIPPHWSMPTLCWMCSSASFRQFDFFSCVSIILVYRDSRGYYHERWRGFSRDFFLGLFYFLFVPKLSTYRWQTCLRIKWIGCSLCSIGFVLFSFDFSVYAQTSISFVAFSKKELDVRVVLTGCLALFVARSKRISNGRDMT